MSKRRNRRSRAVPSNNRTIDSAVSITLCVIVRDESNMIADCLASAAAAVDEIIIVDTGSTDDTVAIARKHGAQVFSFEWIDDFAAARNAAVSEARGKWVLVLDADERLAPGAATVLRNAIRRGDLDCGMLPLHDASTLDAKASDVLSGHKRRGEPVLLPRLMRRTHDLRWDGVVHENIAAWLSAPGRRIRALPAPIIHLGAVPEIREQRAKNARNLRLLHRRVQLQPRDTQARTYLAEELHTAGRVDEALEQAKRAWAETVDQRANGWAGGFAPPVEATGNLLALLLVGANCFRQAAAVIDTAGEWGVRHPTMTFLMGVCCENFALRAEPPRRAALLHQARRCFATCLEDRGQILAIPPISGMTDWWASSRLGQVLLQLEEPKLALAAYEDAMSDGASDIDTRLGHAEALVDLERSGAALKELEPILLDGGADAFLLCAAAAQQMQRRVEAELFLDRAYKMARQHLRAPFRLQRLNRLISTAAA